jgi:hypothetical protein
LIARAGRNVEDAAAGPNLGHVKHHLSCRPLDRVTPRAPAVSALGGLLRRPVDARIITIALIACDGSLLPSSQ